MTQPDFRDGSIEVTSWTDLAGLAEDMAALEAQFRAICDHARRWVCNPAGFRPSPVCLLQPLGEVMEWLATGFDEAERFVSAEWADLIDGVESATADLQALDRVVADALPGVR